jgi:hypothetical protein
MSVSAKNILVPYVIMDAFSDVRYRDELFPDSDLTTLIRHWHGTDMCEWTFMRSLHDAYEVNIHDNAKDYPLICLNITSSKIFDGF